MSGRHLSLQGSCLLAKPPTAHLAHTHTKTPPFQGWHLELDNPEEPLTFKGVVFNEMKGVYSSPDSMFYRRA